MRPNLAVSFLQNREMHLTLYIFEEYTLRFQKLRQHENKT